MNTTQQPNTSQEAQTLNIAIGYEVAKLLNLKVNKLGVINTSYGTKSIQGLGATIQRIIEEQKQRLV
jgi:hypothetical protein